MSLFGKLFSFGKENGKKAAIKRSLEYHGTAIKYVTERRDDNDDVVGRGGSLAVHKDEFVINTSSDTIFRCPISEVEISSLMSGDGAIVKGANSLDGGKVRTLTVHFVYYRK